MFFGIAPRQAAPDLPLAGCWRSQRRSQVRNVRLLATVCLDWSYRWVTTSPPTAKERALAPRRFPLFFAWVSLYQPAQTTRRAAVDLVAEVGSALRVQDQIFGTGEPAAS